jgi:transcriptional regulator with XRE-family HTH domain
MAEGDSPTVARRRVRLAIRGARDAAGLTQLQVAEEMEWSLSKVIRIESGEVSISQNDLRPLLSYLGIKDRAQISALVADAKIARTRQQRAWWQAPEYRELSEPLRRLFEFEAVAVAIRNYSTHYIPGPIQTPEYSYALTGSLEDDMPVEYIQMVLQTRQERHDAMLSRLGKSLQFYTLLDESVFRRPIGGPAVFVAQLREIHRLASANLIHVRMLPFDFSFPIANNATFDLLSLASDEADDVMYRENGVTDELIEDSTAVSRHLYRFNQLWLAASNEADTISFVETRIDDLEKTIATSQADNN